MHLRAWCLGLLLCALAPRDAEAASTTVIPPEAIGALKGCWRTADGGEKWIFRAKGADGLDVVREVKDGRLDYAARARIPHDLMYDASTHTFGFSAAGEIHALMFLFTREHDAQRVWLAVSSYSSHAPGTGYHSTGGRFEVRRCS